MDPVGFGLGVVSAVIQTYTAAMSAYDLYLGVADFSSSYQELRMGLMIERRRLDLWGQHVLSAYKDLQTVISPREEGIWRLFKWIFDKIQESLEEMHHTMEVIGGRTAMPTQGDSLDDYLIENLSLAQKSPPRMSFSSLPRRIKFVLRDKKRMEGLLIQLRTWNDSLDTMTSQLERESLRRQLRRSFPSADTEQLQQLRAAAALLGHPDIQQMASARIIMEQGYHSEVSSPSISNSASSLPTPPTSPPLASSEYRLEMNQFHWKGIPYATDQVRATATYFGEDVLVDWRSCQDDTWRRKNPDAFRQRTQNLTKILNSDLKPLKLAILHCVGYLDQNKNVTGYAFRLPPHAKPNQHRTLHDLLNNVHHPDDIPDLGERFELGKALVSTVFEIHNIGWMHKNIQPRNILFWPKGDGSNHYDVSKPFLMGFDIARPNQPGEFSEKPNARPDEEHYRHPDYKSPKPQSFQPSFDMYSLGVILFEIGLWKLVATPSEKSNIKPPLVSFNSDPQLIANMIRKGKIAELKMYMGARYRDAVMACLNKSFDVMWKEPGREQQERQQAYLERVQNQVVDALAVCKA